MAQIIKVQFASGDSHMAADESKQNLYHREYDYFFVGEEVSAKKGQYAVVEAQGSLKIVKVIGVGKYSQKAEKYAIVIFDLESHQDRIAKDKQIQLLKENIYARAEEAKQRQALQSLAEGDEQLSKMLEELKALEASS